MSNDLQSESITCATGRQLLMTGDGRINEKEYGASWLLMVMLFSDKLMEIDKRTDTKHNI